MSSARREVFSKFSRDSTAWCSFPYTHSSSGPKINNCEHGCNTGWGGGTLSCGTTHLLGQLYLHSYVR